MTILKKRIGLIGLGRMGARLTDVVNDLGWDVVAALDASTTPFALGQHQNLADVFTTDANTFWQTSMDAAIIATTAPSHISFLFQGLSCGVRRFLIEKPFCTNIDEGMRALDQVRRMDARVVVNHGRRYCPNYARLMALDGTPAMGSLRAISVTLGAGGLGCLGIHYLDLFNQLFGGPPQRVMASISGTAPPNPRGPQFEDPGACALMVWPDGRRAMLDISDDTGIPPLLEFRYTYGRILVENESQPWRVFHRSDGDRELPLTRYGQPHLEGPLPDFTPFSLMDMSAMALKNLFDDKPVISTIERALDALCVFAAIREAGVTNAPFHLPLLEETRLKSYAIP
ncbi:MAG: Gfo/Idh/MocA family oxidoreductase [Rhodospirillales bacterium]